MEILPLEQLPIIPLIFKVEVAIGVEVGVGVGVGV